MKNKKIISLAEITVLILGIIAIGWAFGSEVRIVSAAIPTDCESFSLSAKEANLLDNAGQGYSTGEIVEGTCYSGLKDYGKTGVDCKGATDKIVVINHCGTNEDIRCCIPKKNKDIVLNTGKCYSNQGECQVVKVTPENREDCLSDPNHKCVKKEWVSKQTCQVGESTGSYLYGECNYPDLNGDGETSLCCVPKEVPAVDADGVKCAKNKCANEKILKLCKGGKFSGEEDCSAKNPKSKCVETDAGASCVPLQDANGGTNTPAAADTSFGKTYGSMLLDQAPLGLGILSSIFGSGGTGGGKQLGYGGITCEDEANEKKAKAFYDEYKTESEGQTGDTLKVTKQNYLEKLKGIGCKSTEAVSGWKRFGASMLSAATWSAIATTALQIIKSQTDEHAGLYNALNYGAVGGFMLGGIIQGAWDGTAGAIVGNALGLSAGAVIFLMTYHEEATQKKTFESVVWQPPLGGEFCHLCNQMGSLPCSEYQCKSLGMGCQLINPGTAEEKCFWMNRNDVNPPEVRPWDDALPADKNYNYIEATNVNPPDKGVQIVYESGSATNKKKCLPPYTPITFGVSLDEPGQCKVDYWQKGDYENMTYYFGGDSLLRYNHTQIMTLPGPQETGNLSFNNGDSFNMYVRCQDANGNSNEADFVFQFCVDEGPDSTPPIIVATDPISGMPVAFNVTTLPVNVYTNEKAKCKWSRFDQTYDIMNNTMTSTDSWGDKVEFNGIPVWKHIATLTGIEPDKENKYYFRCVDNAKVPNKNTESYPYTLIGTKPLEIIEIGPNGTIKDNTDTIKVVLTAKTFGGYKEGEATCSFKPNEEDFNKYTPMFKTGTVDHSQDLYLVEGLYNYDVRCVDLGGNADVKNTTFYVDRDGEAPLVTRLYFENGYLKMNTNEKATCVYSTTDCTYYYNDGININAIDDTTFFTEWSTQNNLYIKCKDIYGNEPYPPTSCTIVARPYDVYVPVSEEIEG